jgi:HEAT repeat protein
MEDDSLNQPFSKEPIKEEEVEELMEKDPIKALLHTDIRVRIQASNLLNDAEKKQNINLSALIEALRSKNIIVRNIAANVLGQLKTKQAIKPLIEILDDEWMPTRFMAINSLASIGDLEAIEPITKLASAEDTKLRVWAIQALGEFGDSRSVELLIEALNDNDNDVRRNAAEALGKIGDDRALAALEWLEQNDESIDSMRNSVKDSAAQAIEKIKQRQVEEKEYSS